MSFFTPTEIKKAKEVTKPQSCLTCGLYVNTKRRKMKVSGKGRKKILLIGSHNTFADEEYNQRFKNFEGEYIRNLFEEYGYDCGNDFWFINSVNCVPVKDYEIREPKELELLACKPYVESVIHELKPDHIISFSDNVNKQLWCNDFSKTNHERWRGAHIPDREFNAYIHPMINVSAIEDFRPEFEVMYERDLHNVIKFIDENHQKPLERFTKEDKYVTVLYNFNDIKKQLKKLLANPQKITFDYETTGLKPYNPLHKTATIAYSISPTQAYAFPFEWPDMFTPEEFNEIKELWCAILEHPDIPLVAHNMKFEDIWSIVKLGTFPVNWDFDTMLATHILDSRRTFCGLKFQTYLRFGRRPYDGLIDVYIKSDKDVEFNDIFNAPLHDLLIYNGLDCIYTEMYDPILREQFDTSIVSELNPELTEWDAYDMYHDLTLIFSTMEIDGIPCDDAYYQRMYKEVGVKIDELEKYLHKGEEAKKFKKRYGFDINLSSSQQLGNLFYDILNYPEILNKEGRRTVGKEALKEIQLPFVKKLIKLTKLQKVKNTYVQGHITHSRNNLLHASFNLSTTVSFRSSISSPSMQNVPVRDEESKTICRGGLIPSKGFHIGEADWSGIEVAIGCAYHKDPNMIKYVSDPSTDMHRDTAMDLFKLSLAQMKLKGGKAVRQAAKHGFVFPQFYGDYWKQCAPKLFEERYMELGDGTLKDHMESVGLHSLEVFQEHVRKMEKTFWYKRFPVYNQWRKDQFELYLKQGYIDTYTGFKHKGILSKKDTCNHNIQGEAYRAQAWVMMQLDRELREGKFQSRMINQVHDSIIFDLHPAEIDDVFHLMEYYGTNVIKKLNKWINVPLKIDFDLAPVNRPWSEKSEYKLAA